jgi:hypothetical protein
MCCFWCSATPIAFSLLSLMRNQNIAAREGRIIQRLLANGDFRCVIHNYQYDYIITQHGKVIEVDW